MPLRDHFGPPVDRRHSWDELHGGWPMVIVQKLFEVLPPGFVAAPNVHLGTALLAEFDEYEVRIYDERFERRLVAAIDLISPSNKDRPNSRRALVDKVAALLRRDVCVSLVDVVTVLQFNLYAELLELLGRADPALGQQPPSLYAVTLRSRRQRQSRAQLDTWFYPMQLGQGLPSLPVWLDADLCVAFDLEAPYEETCRWLRIV